MLVLVNPKALTASLAVAPATTQPTIVVAYADVSVSSIVENTNEITLTGTTPVTVLATPAVGVRSVIKSVLFTNLDTATVTVTLFLNSVASCKVSVASGNTIDLSTLTSTVPQTSTSTVPTATLMGNNSGITAAPSALSATAVLTLLGIPGLQTTGITGNLTLTKTGVTARTWTYPDVADTVVGLALSQTFTGANVFQNAAGIKVRQGATTDALVIAPSNIGSGSNTITETTPATALGANFTQTRQAATGLVPLLEVNPVQSFRNKIINGDFRIWQRGNAVTVTHSANIYSADRFFSFVNGSGATMSANNIVMTPGTLSVETPTYFRFLVTGAGSGSTTTIPVAQRIEDARTLANKRIVISFWAKADITRSYTPRVTQSFGTGGSPSADVVLTGSAISVTSSWAQYTQAFTVGSISGKAFGSNTDSYLEVALVGPNNVLQTFDICLMEVREAPASEGTLQLPWESRPYQIELGMCQRYYETSNGDAPPTGSDPYLAVTTGVWTSYQFKATKRATPTLVITFGGGTGASFAAGKSGFWQSAAHNALTTFGFTASAEL